MSQAEALLDRLLPTRDLLRRSDVPSEYLEHSVEVGGNRLELSTRAVAIGDELDIRVAHFRSPKIEIISFFAYPEAALALPITVLEYVCLSGRPIVGVVDMVELHGQTSQPHRLLTEAHRRWPDISHDHDQPDWFVECRSGAEFYTRPATMTQLDRLIDVTAFLMNGLLTGEVAARSPDPCAHGARLAHYREHHRVNSPGLPLMRTKFGEAWTRGFTEDYFFA